MHPRRSNLHALFADTFVREFDVGDGIDVRTDFRGHSRLDSKAVLPATLRVNMKTCEINISLPESRRRLFASFF